MSYQQDPLGTIEFDLNKVNEELDQVIELRTAVTTLLAINEPCGQKHLADVQKAAHVVAGADFDNLLNGCDVSNMTLAEIAMELDSCEEAIREERDSFARAYDELLVHNRGQTMKKLAIRIEAHKNTANVVDPESVGGICNQARLEAYEEVMDLLKNVKPKYQ